MRVATGEPLLPAGQLAAEVHPMIVRWLAILCLIASAACSGSVTSGSGRNNNDPRPSGPGNGSSSPGGATNPGVPGSPGPGTMGGGGSGGSGGATLADGSAAGPGG